MDLKQLIAYLSADIVSLYQVIDRKMSEIDSSIPLPEKKNLLCAIGFIDKYWSTSSEASVDLSKYKNCYIFDNISSLTYKNNITLKSVWNQKDMQKALTEVCLSDVTWINGSSAFKGYSNLSSISLNGLKKITSSYTFSNISGLREISLENLLTSGSGMFKWTYKDTDKLVSKYGLSNLSSVYLPKLTEIKSLTFYNCVSLKKVDIQSAKSLASQSFYNCKTLLTLDLPNCKTTTNAFYGCEKLETLNCTEMTEFNELKEPNFASLKLIKFGADLKKFYLTSLSFAGATKEIERLTDDLLSIDFSSIENPVTSKLKTGFPYLTRNGIIQKMVVIVTNDVSCAITNQDKTIAPSLWWGNNAQLRIEFKTKES